MILGGLSAAVGIGALVADASDHFNTLVLALPAIIAAVTGLLTVVVSLLNRRTAKAVEVKTDVQTKTLDRTEAKLDTNQEVAKTAAEANKALHDWLIAETAKRRADD